MTYRPIATRLLPSMLYVCVLLPGRGMAQPPACTGPGCHGPHHHGKAGALPPPGWGYYGLPGGPYLTTDYPFVGWPGYRGAYGGLWPFGPHACRPPVPVYGPLPAMCVNPDPVHKPAKAHLGLGVGYYGWVGPYRASPRPLPTTVSVWPQPGPGSVAVAPSTLLPAGDCLTMTVKVPDAAAEVFVDGGKTAQTGTDRVFESPPAGAGEEIRYELTARWVERGVAVERTKVVAGKPGEVVRVDFTSPDAATTRR